MPDGFQISFVSADGEERDEAWASLEAFRVWALAQDEPYAYTAYREDEDGEWVVVEKGRIGGTKA